MRIVTVHEPILKEEHNEGLETSTYPIQNIDASKDFTIVLIFPMTVLAGDYYAN